MLLGQNKKRAFQLPGTHIPQEPDMPATANQQPFVNNPAMAAQAAQLMPVDQPKPKFFGQGGTGRFIAGSIGDALQQWAGGQATFAQHRQMQQAAEQRASMMQQKAVADQEAAQRDRAAKWEDWQRQYDYERGNPKAMNNDTVADYNFWKGVLPEDQFKTYVQNKVTPPQMVLGMDGVPRFFNQPTPSTGPKSGDVVDGYRFKGGNPSDQSSWEPVGGQTVAPSGTFPR